MPILSANSCRGNSDLVSLLVQRTYAQEILITYFCDSVFYDFLVGHIAFVAHKQLVDAFGSIAINLLQPLLHVVEGFHVCYVIHDTDTVCTAVVGGCDSSETFLSCRIPLFSNRQKASKNHIVASAPAGFTNNLEFHSLAIQLDRPDFLALH
jgi:hypothetical protein